MIGVSIFTQLYTQASSKFFLAYNRHPKKAISLVMTEQEAMTKWEDCEEEDSKDTEAKLLAIGENCHLKAKANIDAAQEKQKKQYDSKHNALKVS